MLAQETHPEQHVSVLDVARFWSRVEVRKDSQCWPWRYGATDDGYGEYRAVDTARDQAHRYAFRIVNGLVPAGCVVRHTCDNRLCCNPAHLKLGTHADNVADRVARDRSAKGEDNGRAVVSEANVREIRRSPLSAQYWANRLDVHEDTIAAIRERKTWKHLP